MLPLNDMLAAQDGQAFEALARQFGLSQQQARAAVEAVLPAFSQGLKQNVADPYGLGAFLTALSSGRHASYFENPANAFSPAGLADGKGILGHLFGSKDLSRVVAQQASAATGIGTEVIGQMLPALAAMIMGGLFKQTAGQFGSPAATQPGAATGNPMLDMMTGMMGQPRERTSEQPNPTDNPFGRMMQEIFAAASVKPAATPEKTPYADNPFGRMVEEWMRMAQPGAAPEESPKANPSGRPRTPWDDLFGDMFESGARQRDDYQKNMEAVVDRYLGDMGRKR